jgi:GNAT superfamily N-acetyltransferase
MSIQIREHHPGRDIDDFVRLPELLYTGDPGFVMPLYMEQRDRLTPSKNPFFQHAEATLFTAYQEGKLVGRISAQIDREHLARYADSCGLFGFFDTINDQRVGKALVDAAASWLRARGMRVMRGPFSLSVNEECGTLVEGQAEAPMVMMPYHRAYQDAIALGAGLTKAKDLFGWKYTVGQIPPRALRANEEIKAMPEVRIRPVDKKNVKRDVRIVADIFNDAWSDNFHFVPMTEPELLKMTEDMKLLLDDQIAMIAEIDGKPAAMAIALPNLSEASYDLGGKLFPLGLPKLLYRLKVKRTKSARLVLLGIKKDYRNKKRYGGMSAALYVELARRGSAVGYTWGELGWTLEDNRPVNLGIKMMGGEVYKRYRIYEKALV